MGKSLYSISLSDEVVAAIDRLARMSGTNRSALINSILAEHISFETPEQQMRALYGEIARCMRAVLPDFRLPSDLSDGAYTAVTSLNYKYNPSIRYSVVLFTDDTHYVGKIRIALRTQNEKLLDDFLDFCVGWKWIEDGVSGDERLSSVSRGTYTKLIIKPSRSCCAEDIAKAISDYVDVMNKCCRIYMEENIGINEKSDEILALYKEYKGQSGYTV